MGIHPMLSRTSQGWTAHCQQQIHSRHCWKRRCLKDGKRQGCRAYPQMAKIINVNVRGMNGPTKQEDLKIFLFQQQVGLIGFIETKVQLQNVDQVMRKICNQWQWDHNATHTKRGIIIVSQHPSKYSFKTLQKNNQLIHSEVIQYFTSKKFI